MGVGAGRGGHQRGGSFGRRAGGGRRLSHWSDAINYDRVKRVINVYLSDFQLGDRDLERFLAWFEDAQGGRRTLAWLLERHAKGWDGLDDDQQSVGAGEERDTTHEPSQGANLQNGDSPAARKEVDTVTKPPGMNWHLQENQITDEGVKILMAFLARIQLRVEVRRFYLYKNIIGTLASFIWTL